MAETAAPEYVLLVPQGADFGRTFRWLNTDGTPKDLTGYRAKAAAKLSFTDDEYLWYLDSEEYYSLDGSITLGGALGTVALSFPSEATGTFDYEEGQWQLEVFSPAGMVTRLAQGTTRLDRTVIG